MKINKKNSKYYIFASILVTVSLFALTTTSAFNMNEENSSNIATAQMLLVQPESLSNIQSASSLSVISERVADTLAIDIARNTFSINGELKPISHGQLILDNGKEIRLFDNGAIEYLTPEFFDVYHSTSMSQKEVLSYAETFMSKLKDNNLIPDDPRFTLELKDVMIGSESTFMLRDGTVIDEKIHYMNVVYEQRFNGIEIVGGSNDVVVSIGEDGEVIAFRGYWRNLAITDDVTVRMSPQKAIDSVVSESNYGTKGIISTPWEKVVIDSVEPVYVFTSPYDKEPLVPQWGIKGTIHGADNDTKDFFQTVRMG